MARTGRFNLIRDYGLPKDSGYVTTDPYWIMAVVRVGLPLSFSRQKMQSVVDDVRLGVKLRNSKPLIITDDCINIQIQGSKRSHTKSLKATLKGTTVNYLTEILGDDWVFAWTFTNRDDYESVLTRLTNSDISACNLWDGAHNDGFKFMGRVHNVRKRGASNPQIGTRTSEYTVEAVAFKELDTQFYYDYTLASQDVVNNDFGLWLARIGIDLNDIFRSTAAGVPDGNVNDVALKLFDVIVGRGPNNKDQPTVDTVGGQQITATAKSKEAPNAYLVPSMAGKIIGREDTSKPNQMLSYADLIDWQQGIQSFTDKSEDYLMFVPERDASRSTNQRLVSPKKMLGTFLPQPPSFLNKPVWSVLQQYVNPAINEMYTAFKVNAEGLVVPTIVFRQIPFTTDCLNQSFTNNAQTLNNRHKEESLEVTRFLDMPRWIAAPTLVLNYDIGRSNATRFNFIHVYGASSIIGDKNVPVQAQMIAAPPIRDDIDIQRSGLHSYMTTVDCWVGDQAADVPGKWMSLIADWTIGSQYTLNGHVTLYGVQSPICEGDNFELDGVVYHIESVSHSLGIDPNSGAKHFITSLQLTNGMRAETDQAEVDDQGNTTWTTQPRSDVGVSDTNTQPIYPGFDKFDNTLFDAGLGFDGQRTFGGERETNKEGLDDATDQTPPLKPTNNNK